MFNILNAGQLYCVTETIEDAIRIVQHCERDMDRLREHSPWTIEPASEECTEEPSSVNETLCLYDMVGA
jgi:hypothetical protein